MSNCPGLTLSEIDILARLLMKKLAERADLSTDEIPYVDIRAFTLWCQANEEPLRSAGEISEATGIAYEKVELFWELLQDPYFAVETLLPIWPKVQLMGRPPCRHCPERLTVDLTLSFDGGAKRVHLGTQAQWRPEAGMTDGIFLAGLKHIFTEMLADVTARGVDGLYEHRPKRQEDDESPRRVSAEPSDN